MTKRFQWLSTALCRTESVLRALARAHHAPRPRLESTHERFDAHAHPLRGCYLGLLAGTSGPIR